MISNPFAVEPLAEWNLEMLYVNRDEEKELLPYVTDSGVMLGINNCVLEASRNFVVIGGKGSGKSTLMARIKKSLSEDPEMNVVVIPQIKSGSVRELLGQIYTKYLENKQNKEKQEMDILTNFQKNMSYRLFSVDKLLELLDRAEIVVLIDNAQFLFKHNDLMNLITTTGHELKLRWGLFMTPKTYYLWAGDKDHDGFLDRFNLILKLKPFTYEQVLEMIAKRLAFSQIDPRDFLTEIQIKNIVTSLNGMPRAVVKTCKILYEGARYNEGNERKIRQITDSEVIYAIATVKLEELDIMGLEEEYKQLLKVFMSNEGIITTRELLSQTTITQPTLYRKLNFLMSKGYIYPKIDDMGNEVRGSWELDPTTASLLAFGANGEFCKPFEDQD